MLLACGAVCVVLHCTNATVDAVDDVAADAVAVGDTIAITPAKPVSHSGLHEATRAPRHVPVTPQVSAVCRTWFAPATTLH